MAISAARIKRFSASALLTGCLSLGGCNGVGDGIAGTPASTSPTAQPVMMPTAMPGDRYNFGDAGTWQLVGPSGRGLIWRNKAGQTREEATNPFLPLLTEGNVRRTILDGDETLFPLKVGNRAVWRIQESRGSTKSEYDWRCEVGASIRITVPAGDFDTITVTCRGDGILRIAAYAPEIGHIVRVVEQKAGQEKRAELMAWSHAAAPGSFPRNPDAAKPAAAKPPTSKPVAAKPAAVAAPPAPSAASGGFAAHLASFRSEADAKAAWTGFVGKYPSLAGRQPVITIADLPGKGRYFRLFASPTGDRSQANTLCQSLKSAGLSYCAPMATMAGL